MQITTRSPAPTTICECSLEDLEQHGFSYPPDAASRMYRFIDCEALVNDGIFRVVEFQALPSNEYACISYVWDGLERLKGSKSRYFQVCGVRHAHPIAIHVLVAACQYALAREARYLWLDIICIMQLDIEDKNWQIQTMATIYAQCSCSVVLPGGLQRLLRARLRETSVWAIRHWTLQEAVLPRDSVCLFEWKLGPGMMGGVLRIESLSENVAYFSLQTSMAVEHSNSSGNFVSDTGLTTVISSEANFSVWDIMFSGVRVPSYWSAYNCLWRLLLTDALSTDTDIRDCAIWHSMFWRTSSIAVDAVYSSMGILGVQLDPQTFLDHPTPRRAATIKLAQVYLHHGGKAHWLSMVVNYLRRGAYIPGRDYHHGRKNHIKDDKNWPRMDPTMCTMLSIPESDDPKLSHDNVTKYSSNNVTRLQSPPVGSMDDDGYLSITVPGMLLPLTECFNANALADLKRDLGDDMELPSEVWAVHLGNFEECHPQEREDYSFSSSSSPAYLRTFPHQAILVLTAHAPEKFHILGLLKPGTPAYYGFDAGSPKLRTFAIGGPYKPGDIESNQGEVGGAVDKESLGAPAL